jgi:3'(2'), 5'-bisphosphate nucleotidase
MNELLTIAIEASKKAGEEIMRLYATTAFETKNDGSPVTIADTRSNEILMERLGKTGIPILSEELEGVSLPYPKQLWIIDPLDGTKDFINKSNDFSVMIGLIEHGVPILGVVYAPALDTLYFATKGNGAFVTKGEITSTLTVSNREHENLRFVRSVNHFSWSW